MTDDIEVPADLEVTGASGSPESLAQPDQNSPSTGTEKTAEHDDPPAEKVEGDEPEAEPTGNDDPEQPSGKKSPWFVERIAKQREANAALARQNEELNARLAAYQRQQTQDDPNAQQQQPSQADLQALVRAEAQRIAEQTAIQQRLSGFDAAGRKAFPDFVDRCNTVASLGGADNPAFMSIVTDLDDGHAVVARLADDPAKTMEILAMPPLRMAAALARLSGQTVKPPSVSKAPAPVKPIGGQGRTEKSDADMSDDEWARKHQVV